MGNKISQLPDDKKINILKEFQEHAEIYFNSLESAFLYTVARKNRPSFLEVLIGTPVLLLLMFSIFPAVPSLLQKRIPEVWGNSIQIWGLEIPLNTLAVWWPACAVISYGLFRLWSPLDKRLTAKRKSKELQSNLMPFCHLYKAIKEIRAYVLNQRPLHLDTASKNLRKYLYWSDITIPSATLAKYLRGEAQKVSANNYDLIRLLQDNYFWFVASEQTTLISKAFEEFGAKILERVNQTIELDSTIRVLEYLALYEFSSIKKPIELKFTSIDATIDDIGKMALLDYSIAMSTLTSLEKIPVTKQKRSLSDLFSKVAGKGNDLLKHPNLIVCFLAWYVFLSLLFIPISLLLIHGVLKIQIDSTIIVGVLTAPFAAAIVFAAAIYSKSGK